MVMQLLHQLPEGAGQSAELCFACLHSSVKSVASCTH